MITKFDKFLNESKNDEKVKFGILYHPIIIPPNDIKKCKELMLKIYADEKWNDDNGKLTVSTKDEIEEILKQKNGELILKHETLHALQIKKAPYLFKGSTELGDDITADKEKYISIPSEIMAFAYSNAIGDKKNYKELYKKIGGNVYKLYNFYVDEYKKQL